jgi:hypothetical protein
MALGYNARPTGSDRVHIGNTSITSISGQVSFTTYSDGRFKRNITENVGGLDFIKRLRPVTYNLDVDGIADRLKEDTGRDEKGEIAAAFASGYDFSGVDAPQNEDSMYGLRYAEFVVPLIKAVQEQQEMIDSIRNENAALQENYSLQVEALQLEIADLRAQVTKLQDRFH